MFMRDQVRHPLWPLCWLGYSLQLMFKRDQVRHPLWQLCWLGCYLQIIFIFRTLQSPLQEWSQWFWRVYAGRWPTWSDCLQTYVFSSFSLIMIGAQRVQYCFHSHWEPLFLSCCLAMKFFLFFFCGRNWIETLWIYVCFVFFVNNFVLARSIQRILVFLLSTSLYWSRQLACFLFSKRQQLLYWRSQHGENKQKNNVHYHTVQVPHENCLGDQAVSKGNVRWNLGDWLQLDVMCCTQPFVFVETLLK